MRTGPLKTLILGDPTALALMNAKDDDACAVRCTSIAPKVHAEVIHTEKSVYTILTPEVAEPLIQKLEIYASTVIVGVNAYDNTTALKFIVKRALSWLKPGEGGWNFGSSNMITLVQALRQANVITAEDRNNIFSLSLVSDKITAEQIEFVRLRTE